MKELNLTLHCGGYRTDLEAVEAVPTPAPQNRWHPIPHIELHRSVERSIGNMGLKIASQVHALGRGGNHYFGLYQVVANENPEMGLVLGTRNSHNKEFVAGLAAGEGVFACDNLAFWAEVVLGRMHTTHIMRDLPGVCDKAVSMLAEKWTGAEKRVAAYKEHGFTDALAHDFVVRSLDTGVITAQAVPRVLKEWRTPSHAEFTDGGRTAWRLFNAYTEEFKRVENPAALMRRSQVLHGMMSVECGILARN